VPKLAQEGHRKAIDATVEEALKRAGVAAADLSAVSVTVGPGLGLCLQVGVKQAYSIAAKHRLPLVRVHHMEAHALVARLPKQTEIPETGPITAAANPAFPFLTLLVSGGHNMAVLTRGLGNHHILGSTIDDSVGEAFDKTARLLGITQVPGGPHLEKLAREGDDTAVLLPKPLSKTRDLCLQTGCDFSFSGLKTAVRQHTEKEFKNGSKDGEDPLAEGTASRKARADIAASFQRVAVEHLCQRAARALEWAQEMEPDLRSMVVAGGVAANQQVRKGLTEVASDAGLEMSCPPPRLCVDNGVMVAWAGIERLRAGLFEAPPSEAAVDSFVEVRPRWPLGERDERSSRGYVPKIPKQPKQSKKHALKQASSEKPEAEGELRKEEPEEDVRKEEPPEKRPRSEL
jgi:N6-L-threonylcarbamoyladenine synthase